jgi:type IV pilus assembly protein PilP
LISAALALAIGVPGLGGCGDESGTEIPDPGASAPAAKPAAADAKKDPAADPKAAAEEAPEAIEKIEDAYVYTSIGKRDPFVSYFADFTDDRKDAALTTELEKFDISQLKLVGIVTGISNPRAMVEDPTGKGYIITRGTLVGKYRGRVTSIQKEEVIITEEYRDVTGRRVTNHIPLRLPIERVE